MSQLIPLSKGQVAIVDDADFERVNHFKWCSQSLITLNNKQIYIGIFDTAEGAGKAYDRVAPKIHGSFARTNF